ncbi:MAG: ATP-binding cassette domain-containing protein [Puniceicoccales bacterium]|jgi:ATP-binding cassette subfamily F protein uup|nr:ATP-binding cassette domain-containing protein [Puniceicoccales bacterium]
MALLALHDVTLSHGGPRLLDGASFQIDPGDRLGLVGRNGAGKTTLMRLLSGEIAPDSGAVESSRGLRVGILPQDVPDALDGSVRDIVLAGARANPDAHARAEAGLVADRLLTRMALPEDAPFNSLSAGMRRRVLLARELACAPDLLLLDEPTNHLDVASIEFLEGFLASWRGAILVVSHDRRFIQRVATAILDLDRGKITRWDCPYEKFLERKEAWLEAEASANAEFDKKLAREEAWLRQGVKARRCRNEGRVRALQKLRVERRSRRDQAGLVRAGITAAGHGGEKVLEAVNVSFSWPGQPPLVRDFSMRLMRGDRIGLLGPNGSGKTTLLKLLLGELAPASGVVKHGTNLAVAYYDQLRAQLDPARTVAENLSPDSDHVSTPSGRRHVITYLGDFLFPPDRARSPVSMLSGGERNRLLLAKLLLRPANVLVLDEPTNDLDIETLELLEELVSEFPGTVLLVSHDRAFLDNVTTSYLVFEGGGEIREFNGDYESWRDAREARAAADAKAASGVAAQPPAGSGAPVAGKKLSNKEKEELSGLPARIEALEAEHAALVERLNDPGLYRDPAAAKLAHERLPALDAEIHRAYSRWSELEERPS